MLGLHLHSYALELERIPTNTDSEIKSLSMLPVKLNEGQTVFLLENWEVALYCLISRIAVGDRQAVRTMALFLLMTAEKQSNARITVSKMLHCWK